MRRFTTAIAAVALALSFSLGYATPAAAITGYDSSYQFESAFLTLNPGETGTFSAFFANTGSTSWVKGSGTQVNLATCLDDKLTCNVPPEEAAFASGWLSSTAYATHTKDTVIPGDFSAFTYNVKVPAGQAAGTYRFNGDLVLASSGAKLHPEGYYQDVTVPTAPVAAGPTVSPDFGAANDKANEVSGTVPGNGQHTVTFTGLPAGTVDLAVIASFNATKNADGTYGFCDTNQDRKSDGVGGGATFITAVNGKSVTASTVIVDEAVPANGTMTVTIDSATRNQRVRVVAWQDKNNNGQIDLTGAGDVNCDAYTAYDSASDGVLVASGRKFYTGPEGTFGTQFGGACTNTFRYSGALQMFTAGPTGDTSNRYDFDSNDIFRINGTPVTIAQFRSSLTPGATADDVTINYNPDPAGTSEFNICANAGAAAPSDLSAAVGNFDSGSAANDVRLTFTAPATNTITAYTVQRATGSCAAAFVTIGSVSADAGKTGTFTDFDRPDGSYCYRIRTVDAVTGAESFSNTVLVTVPGTADTARPLSLTATLSQSAGFANTLDAGDKIEITFTEAVSLSANATIRVTDSDCGEATQTGPAACSGGQTNTVADIVCGTNATCTLNAAKTVLLVTMSAGPTIVAAGSTAGVQYPAVITDSSGITDTSGNQYDPATSGALGGDRVIP